MVSITYKAIIPKEIDVKRYASIIQSQLRKEGSKIETLYKGIHNTWSKPVKYDNKLTFTSREIKVRVSTRDVRLVNLDLGTKKRWAVMSNPFTPKTRIRKLRSFRGKGKPVIRGKLAMQPRGIKPMPGIKPREFSKEIVKIRRPKFQRDMTRAMKQAARGTF